MSVKEIIEKVKEICLENGASEVLLFGSYAKGTERMGSDIDIVVKGTQNFHIIKEQVDDIKTLEEINLFNYDKILNKSLLEDIDRYGKVI